MKVAMLTTPVIETAAKTVTAAAPPMRSRTGRERRRRDVYKRQLVGREEDEADAVLGEKIQRFKINGGFRKPHAFRQAPEATAEVGDAPANLRNAVAGIGQRHDDVVVDLSHGRAVAGKTLLRCV